MTPVAPLLFELGRVVPILMAVERERRTLGPRPAAARARARGRAERARSSAERKLLQRAIQMLDTRMPGGPNCLRRALLEMSLDQAAAAEPLYLQITRTGDLGSGHARLESWPDDGRAFDATFVI